MNAGANVARLIDAYRSRVINAAYLISRALSDVREDEVDAAMRSLNAVVPDELKDYLQASPERNVHWNLPTPSEKILREAKAWLRTYA